MRAAKIKNLDNFLASAKGASDQIYPVIPLNIPFYMTVSKTKTALAKVLEAPFGRQKRHYGASQKF